MRGISLRIFIAWVNGGTVLLVPFLVSSRNIVRHPRLCYQRSPSNSILRISVSSASLAKVSIDMERRPVSFHTSNRALVSAASSMQLRSCGFFGLATSANGLLMPMFHFLQA